MKLWHPRVLTRYLVSRVTLVPNYCKQCGRDAEPFTVPDTVWREVIGENANNERCLRCFHAEAEQAGVALEWRVTENNGD